MMLPRILVGCFFAALVAAQESGPDLDLGALVRPIPPAGVFQDPGHHIWCSALTRSDDGRYHLFYARWPGTLSHKAWVTHSEIAHAIGDNPIGPFTPVDVALPARGKERWDGLCTHNPTILRAKDGRYLLYYMGNTGDGVHMQPMNWTHRNNQRIGVAIADSPQGPWKRFDRPALDVSADPDAPDALMVSNPAVTQRPDGGYLMIYKGVAKKKPLPGGGPISFLVATAERPEGPFTKALKPVMSPEEFGFASEDPCVWTGADRYWAIIRLDGSVEQVDGVTRFVKRNRSLVLFQSFDGFTWTPAKHPRITDLDVPWADGKARPLIAIERPQIYIEDGRPVAVLFATTMTKGNTDGSMAVRIPLAR